jgi:hypothetical protein
MADTIRGSLHFTWIYPRLCRDRTVLPEPTVGKRKRLPRKRKGRNPPMEFLLLLLAIVLSIALSLGLGAGLLTLLLRLIQTH